MGFKRRPAGRPHEAFLGHAHARLSSMARCPVCDGSGLLLAETCPLCDGADGIAVVPAPHAPPLAAPLPLRTLRCRSDAAGLQARFGMLLGQWQLNTECNPHTRPALERGVSAPACLQVSALDPNMDPMLRTLAPKSDAGGDCCSYAAEPKQWLDCARSIASLASELNSTVEEDADEIDKLAFDAAFEGAAFDWSTAGSMPCHPSLGPIREGALAEAATKANSHGQCAICLNDVDLLQLECQHGFCSRCLSAQLAKQWPGPRVVFGYLNCALCRAPLAHGELDEPLTRHFQLRDRVGEIAARKFCEDGLDDKLHEELGRTASKEEVRQRAEEVMAVYMCADCHEPYCGGRADCGQDIDLAASQLRCHACEWEALATTEDRRCMVHGHQYAIFKCDSCCDLATWNCKWHRYCDRCHEQAGRDKDYPCPGPDLCPLGIPHPRNVPANLDLFDDEDPPFRPFVVGCTACLGLWEHIDDWADEHPFGFPERNWPSFADGEALLAELGEDEVRARLRTQPPAVPRGGSAVECAERLLLVELGVGSPGALLELAGGANKIKRRLWRLGLCCDGHPLDLARRLLLVRRAEGIEALEQLEAREKACAEARSAGRAARQDSQAQRRVLARSERQRKAMEYFMKRARR